MDGNPVMYTDPQGDKIRGSLKGMISFYRQRAKLERMKAEIIDDLGNTDPGQVNRLRDINRQIRDMDDMRGSDIVFNIKIGKVNNARGPSHDSKVTVNQRGIHRAFGRAGRVDIVLDEGATDNSAGLAQAVTISGLFLGGQYSFTNELKHRGDIRPPKSSQINGFLEDQGDAIQIEGAKLLWLYSKEVEGERQTALVSYSQSDQVQALPDYDRSLSSTRPNNDVTFEQELEAGRTKEWIVRDDKIVEAGVRE